MTPRRLVIALALAIGTVAVRPLLAQEAPAPAHGEQQIDFITPHITDSYGLDLPYWHIPYVKEVCIGRETPEGHCGPMWDPIHIGGLTVNLSPTKHVVMLLVAALLSIVTLVGAARAHQRHTHEVG